MRLVLQELIEAEATEAISAGRYERSDARVTERNGHRPRLLATQAGDVELKIPKLRKGSLLPSVLEPRRRIDRALHAVIMEAYVAGVSTSSVDDLVAALGAESGISKSEVSRICAGLDKTVEAFQGRCLDHAEFPYVYLDATHFKVRNSVSQVASMAMVVATGVTADGNREILGCNIGDSESEGFWQSFLGSLRARGLTGVRLVIADAHAGLGAAADRALQGAGVNDAGCTSSATFWCWCPTPTSTWPPQCSARSSCSPTPTPSTPPTRNAPSPCRATCTQPGSTNSCPRSSPTPPSTGSCTTPTSS